MLSAEELKLYKFNNLSQLNLKSVRLTYTWSASRFFGPPDDAEIEEVERNMDRHEKEFERTNIMTTQQLRNILMIGAGGTDIGLHVAHALANDPSFELFILACASSNSTHPSNAKVVTIPDNATHDDYVKALKGQDVVVSALGIEGKLTEKAIIDAAIEAGVKRFLPSEYGIDNTNPVSRELSPVLKRKADIVAYLKSKEATGLTWTAVPTGMWIDWYFFVRILPGSLLH